MWNQIILKLLLWNYFAVLFHTWTTSETEIKLFQPLKEFENYFKIISATMNTLEVSRSQKKMQLDIMKTMKYIKKLLK